MRYVVQRQVYLAGGGTASRTAAPNVLTDGVRCAGDVDTGTDGDDRRRWQRQGAAFEVVPVAVLERLRVMVMVTAVARQPVQVGRARATAIGVVLLATRRRVRADEYQPPVVHYGRWLVLTWATCRGIRTALPTASTPASDQVQRLQALQILAAAARPRVRSSASP